MTEIDEGYKMLLNVGFIVLREAAQSGAKDWLNAEIEMLHNVPSLIGEFNVHRHRYYWQKERLAYIEWMNHNASAHAKSRMLTFYEPVWNAMAEVMEAHISEHVSETAGQATLPK